VNVGLKDDMPVSFRSELFTSYITSFKKFTLPQLMHDKLPNEVIYACKYYIKMNWSKTCCPQIGFLLNS